METRIVVVKLLLVAGDVFWYGDDVVYSVKTKTDTGDPAFSCEWFFGVCGLDNWGELLPDKEGDHE